MSVPADPVIVKLAVLETKLDGLLQTLNIQLAGIDARIRHDRANTDLQFVALHKRIDDVEAEKVDRDVFARVEEKFNEGRNWFIAGVGIVMTGLITAALALFLSVGADVAAPPSALRTQEQRPVAETAEPAAQPPL